MVKRLHWLSLFVFAAGILSAPPAFPEVQPAFGPERFEWRLWGPLVMRKAFTSEASGEGFVMKIANGGADGAHRVWLGSVKLNGRHVAGPLDFLWYRGEFDREVSLKRSNIVEVSLLGPPGSFIVVTIAPRTLPPVVELAVTPGVITKGSTATLTWSARNADQCTLDQGLGGVPTQGSMTVSPRQNTTYTLVARGAGGTASASTMVTVQNRPPVALDDLAATEEGSAITIHVLGNDSDPDGDPLRLVSITPGSHGTAIINPDGTVSYFPAEGFVGPDLFVYDVSDDCGGAASATVSVTVRPHPKLSLEILSPEEGRQLTYPWLEVRGSVYNPWGTETGVAVNGKPAAVSDGVFLASRVSLVTGENVITATATDIDGHTATSSITVYLTPSMWQFHLTTLHYTGLAPLETTLSISTSPNYSTPSLSWTGPGEVEALPGTDPAERKIRILTEGFYQFTAEATDRTGQVHVDTVSILVLSREELDGLIRTKWTGMKEQLQSGAVEEALGYLVESSRERYRTIFNSLGTRVSAIVAGMQDIQLVSFRNRFAEYRINREHSIDGQPVTITYSIYFVVDDNGFWKIDRF